MRRSVRKGRTTAAMMALGLAGSGLAGLGAADSAWAARPAEQANSATQDLYRLYNRISHEHLYTADANEVGTLVRGDWTCEGVGWVAPVRSSTPVYRLYNPILGDHHYTVDAHEVKVLTAEHHWVLEGTGWYSSDGNEVPVFRQFHSGLAVGAHHYTGDTNEYEVNIFNNGWRGEGVAWYAAAPGNGECSGPEGMFPGVADTPQARAEILAEARQLIGTPYLFGGSSPEDGGMDCSGLVAYVYSRFGYHLPRTSGEIADAGTPVPASEAQPGDVMWWPGHVAIYTGNGQIEAMYPGVPLIERNEVRDGAVYLRFLA